MPFVVRRRVVTSQDGVLEAAMVSWLEELERREAAAREEIAELRDRIEELSLGLVEREKVLTRLEITRETMTEIHLVAPTTTPHVRGDGRVSETGVDLPSER
ncbi:hypothetical protein [Streptomyces sp. NPDC056660]|uniref:hypothetical protein n=1 Tax=Streptomyces sp. NPDC056660 TaxID=3345897 RepID=UPI00367AEF16